VTSIAIYIEGGGDSTSSKAQLRQGFDALLAPQKDAARARKMHWKLVLCGGRNVKPAIVATRCTSFQDFTKGLDAAIAGT
jgi:hypothetical protein